MVGPPAAVGGRLGVRRVAAPRSDAGSPHLRRRLEPRSRRRSIRRRARALAALFPGDRRGGGRHGRGHSPPAHGGRELGARRRPARQPGRALRRADPAHLPLGGLPAQSRRRRPAARLGLLRRRGSTAAADAGAAGNRIRRGGGGGRAPGRARIQRHGRRVRLSSPASVRRASPASRGGDGAGSTGRRRRGRAGGNRYRRRPAAHRVRLSAARRSEARTDNRGKGGGNMNGPGSPNRRTLLRRGLLMIAGALGLGAGALNVGGERTYAILGGTERYAGARGTYTARTTSAEPTGRSAVDFILTLTA